MNDGVMNQGGLNQSHNPVNDLLSKYRSFLQNNRFALQLVEDLVPSCILYYAPSSHHNSVYHDDEEGFLDANGTENQRKKRSRRRNNEGIDSQNFQTVKGGGGGGVMPESLYAWINLWTFVNDAICNGLGNDNGFTVGISSDIDSSSCASNLNRNTSRIITTLRIVLSIVDCLAPAIEVRAHFYRQRNQNRSGRNHPYQHSRLHVLNVLTKIERVRFICRISILLLTYCDQYKKAIRHQQEQTRNDYRGESMDTSYLAMFGIMKDGGILSLGCNNHETISTDQERKRVKRILYVGKRTGRKVDKPSFTPSHPKQNTSIQNPVKNHNILQSLSKRFDSTTFKICLLAFGEILHLSRPLIQTHALRNCEKQFEVHSNSYNSNEKSRKRRTFMKTWLMSLVMDLISQEFTKLGTTVNVGGNYYDREKDIVNIASSMTKNELYHRKMRLMLYLLRTPVFDIGTLPLARSLSKVFGCVPLIGQPISDYVMDVLMYWHDWHFMMET